MYLDSFLWIPHGVLKVVVVVRFALETLLAEQFEADDAAMSVRLGVRWSDPERDTTFHRRPCVAA